MQDPSTLGQPVAQQLKHRHKSDSASGPFSVSFTSPAVHMQNHASAIRAVLAHS